MTEQWHPRYWVQKVNTELNAAHLLSIPRLQPPTSIYHPRGSLEWPSWRFRRIAYEMQGLLVEQNALALDDPRNTEIELAIAALKAEYVRGLGFCFS